MRDKIINDIKNISINHYNMIVEVEKIKGNYSIKDLKLFKKKIEEELKLFDI